MKFIGVPPQRDGRVEFRTSTCSANETCLEIVRGGHETVNRVFSIDKHSETLFAVRVCIPKRIHGDINKKHKKAREVIYPTKTRYWFAVAYQKKTLSRIETTEDRFRDYAGRPAIRDGFGRFRELCKQRHAPVAWRRCGISKTSAEQNTNGGRTIERCRCREADNRATVFTRVRQLSGRFSRPVPCVADSYRT